MSSQLRKKMDVKLEGPSIDTRWKRSFFTVMLAFTTLLFTNFAQAETGENIFNKFCMSCHSTSSKVLVGPGLGGIDARRTEKWFTDWVHDSQGMIAAGDADAKAVFDEFNQMPMPGFPQFSDDELKDMYAFLASKAEPVATAGSETSTASTSNSSSADTNGAVEIDSNMLFWSFLSLGLVAFILFQYKKRTTKYVNELGFHPDPHTIKNYGGVFFLCIIGAAVLFFLLINSLIKNPETMGTMLFSVFPYVAFGIFIVGSIYRYTKRGYQVSSLSSQFLEGKKLFWGSQPFHWGMLILFFGHLTAFLFPRAILAWNGEPVRLLILEISSFAFGLSALLGLILLIRRRLTSNSLLVVSNKMDMVVYTVLFTQIISGLGVAFFVRWGSSWFSAVLTPYLRSIFSFNPDINAIAVAPWLVQLHIISAFLIIAIIPFTRFMHFLVAPVDYIWRKYQVVIWNWNHKTIRSSKKHTFGKTSRNH
jgi:nitrate reductase gamma subunit